MKIVLIGPYPEDSTCIKGGTESSVYGLAQELVKEHDTIVIDYPRVNGRDAVEKDNQLTVYRYRTPGKHYQDAVRRISDITKVLLDFKPDAVHIHATNVFCYRMYRWCEKQGIRTMLTVHGLAAVEKRNVLRSKWTLHAVYQWVKQTYYERLLLNTVGDCIVDTGYVAEAIRGYNLRRTPTMYVVPQGINARYFRLAESAQPKMSPKTILSVGTISARKGRLQLLQAFDRVCEQVEDVRIVIAGANKDTQMIQRVREYISQSPNRDKICLCPDIPQEELLALYGEAYVFALHTQEESQGIVFAEAMAAGLPVVATQVGGVPYVINDARLEEQERRAIGKTATGYLGQFGDIEEMAQSLVRVLQDESLRKTLSENAKEEARYYNWTTIANTIVGLYQKR